MGRAAAAIYLMLIANCALSALAHSLTLPFHGNRTHFHLYIVVLHAKLVRVWVYAPAPETFLTQIGL